MTETYEEVVSGSNGYTCPKCGMWVWNNAYHVCIGNPIPQYYWPQYYVSDRSQEIVDLLKEIKELLVRIVPESPSGVEEK